MRLRNLHPSVLPPFRRQSLSLTCCLRFVKASLSVSFVATSVARNTLSRPSGPPRNSRRVVHRPTKGWRSYVFRVRSASPIDDLFLEIASPSFDRPHRPHHHTGDSNGGQENPAAAVRWPKPPRSIIGNRTRSPPRENRESLEELRSVPASTEIGLQNHDQQHQTALPTSPAFAARPEDPPPCHRSRTQS